MLSMLNDTDLGIFNSEDPLSDEGFKHFLYHGSVANNNSWFENDGLFPYPIKNTTSTQPNNSIKFPLTSEPNSQSHLVVPIIYCVISFIGLIGNGLVMFVILANKEITKSVANIYICNLAIADTLLLVSLPFTSTQRILLYWPFNSGMCKIIEAVKYLNYFASIFFLTAMSVDRYVAVVYVVRSNKWRTSRNTYIVCGIIWLVSFVMIIPLLVNTQMVEDICALAFDSEIDFSKTWDHAWDKNDYLDIYREFLGEEYSHYAESFYAYENSEVTSGEEPGNKTGLFDYPKDFTKPIHINDEDFIDLCKHPDSKTFHVFLIFSFVIGFVIPFFVITICYIMIVARIVRPTELRTRSKQAERTRRKVTRMVVALVITFFICWLPFYIWHLVKINGIFIYTSACNNVRDFTFCLGFANSCLNPILYTFMGHNFHERLRKSIAISFRSFSLSNFTKYTTNHTVSRGEMAAQKKTERSNVELIDTPTANKISPILIQVQEEPMPSPAVSCNNSIEKLAEDNLDE